MKIRNALSITTLILVASVAGTASANISTGSIAIDVQSAVSSGHVNVVVNDGIATLFGVVESTYDANAAKFAAAKFEGIKRVENLIYVSH